MFNGKRKLLAAALTLMIVTGCSQEQAKPQPTPEPAPAAQPGSTNTGSGQQPDAPAEAAPVQESMDEQAAVTLTSKGITAYWHVMNGGKPAEDGGPVQSFLVDGMDYRYLGTDLDSKQKLYSFLEQYFTTEAVDAFVKHARIIEHEGRMAQPNADSGSILQWDKAQATLAKEAGDSKQYELKVPYGEGASVQFQAVLVEFVNTKENGWLINTPPQELK